jgi:transcriptional regulator with XRE-family HTH domain
MDERGDPEVGRRIRGLRAKAGLTQADVAAELGITRGHVSAIETGKRPVGRETLIAIAALFGASLDFLASRSGEAGAANSKDELEATLLLICRELPREEVEAWVQLMLIRLRDKMRSS